MRRAKMMLKPKLGPSVKQNQPSQVQPQTSKAIEHAVQPSIPPEAALMPPPPAPQPQESREVQEAPKQDNAGSLTDSVQNSVPEVQAETTGEAAPCLELVPINPSAQKSIVGKPRPVKANLEPEAATSLPARRERKPTKKADEFREMLMASRRRFGKVREPIDTSKLTMLDLIYYNPPGAPMKKKATEAAKVVEKLEQQSLEPELEEESNTGDAAKGEAEEEVMGPRVVVGPDGEITIDETSLVIRRPNPLDSKHKLKVTVEEAGKARYNSFKTRKMKKCTWTTKETSKFYQALSICGTDFTLMTQFFPSRSRQDLKNKFKREEKSNSALIDKAIHHPTQFEYTDFEMEDIAKDDNEPQKTKSPKSGAKGTRKRKAKTVDSVDSELLALTDKPANEKFPTLRVARPKRNRAKVDYAGLNESPPEEPTPVSPEPEKEPAGRPTEETGDQAQEETSNVVETTTHTLINAASEDPMHSRSPARVDDTPPAVFEVPSEVIDEVSQITEQLQPQESPVENPRISEKKIEARVAGKQAESLPRASARKIPAPVFKPRHRKAALRPLEPKRAPAQKSLPSVSETEPQKSTDRTSTEEESPPANSDIGSSVIATSPTASAELTGTDATEPLRTAASPVESEELPRAVDMASPSTRVSTSGAQETSAAGSPSSSAHTPVSSPSLSRAGTPGKKVSPDGIEISDKISENLKATTLPKLVLPNRPMSNRIIRPIGAAKTRGVVLSPLTKRRAEPAEQDQ